jgi:hypothetical protein
MSCFEYLTLRTWCSFQGDVVDASECATCDEPACEWSRAAQSPDRRRTP